MGDSMVKRTPTRGKSTKEGELGNMKWGKNLEIAKRIQDEADKGCAELRATATHEASRDIARISIYPLFANGQCEQKTGRIHQHI